MQIRAATMADGPVACTMLRRSIIELCLADHDDDPEILARWLDNKTPENGAAWIARLDNSMLVAVEGDRMLSVGAATDTGEITLNYVSADARFRGVSRAMLAALEARALERGNHLCHLLSSATARRFYLANGTTEDGLPQNKFGTRGSFPMSKVLDR